MMLIDQVRKKFKPPHEKNYRTIGQFLHIDFLLGLFLCMLSVTGLLILYSASSQNLHTLELQILRFVFSLVVMLTIAQISPETLKRAAPWFYGICLGLLLLVMISGHVGKGAQRWFSLGLLRLQPSELMKVALPLILAWYYHQIHLPITVKNILTALPLILIPAVITAKQPDLATALILILSGASVLFLAGLSVQIICAGLATTAIFVPFSWFWLYDYQKQRVLTFFNPEHAPLDSGYHIIQSKIALGSGGVFGKGLFNGTQSNLHFLPEHSTDFIFAVCGEECGFVGSMILIGLYVLIMLRGFYITIHAQDTFSRLMAGSITFSFFASFFINMGMVTGILPVAGVPLPLISYGGSSMVTFMASFGILMSIQTHRKLVTT